MTTTEELLYKLRESLVGIIEAETINSVESAVLLALDEYELIRKERSLIVYERTDEDIINRFFLAKAVQGCTKRTLELYKRNLQQAIRTMNKHIKDITADDVRVYLAKKKIQKCSSSYLANIHRTLSSFFTWAAAEELVEKNPMLRVEKIKIHYKPEEALTDEQMELIRYCCKTKREKALVEFLYSTGCRIAEACALNLSDVDFDKDECQVLGKGQKYRTVYISQRCKFAMKDYINNRKDSHPALFAYDFDPIVGEKLRQQQIDKFGIDGRLTPDEARVVIKRIGMRAGIRLHPHLLRKTLATQALRRGMPIEEVRLMLGHESIATTTIYAQTQQDSVKISHGKFV